MVNDESEIASEDSRLPHAIAVQLSLAIYPS